MEREEICMEVRINIFEEESLLEMETHGVFKKDEQQLFQVNVS